MFKAVSPKVDVQAVEQEILSFWRANRVFERTLEEREGAEKYVFYEGPPTANGLPGSHHVLARVFKDIFPRYKTMQGYYCLRRGGWDTHGLPVEIGVEKELGISYPTVRGRLDTALGRLGLTGSDSQDDIQQQRGRILKQLDNGEIDVTQATALLKSL